MSRHITHCRIVNLFIMSMAASIIGFACWVGAAQAQGSYPDKPIRIIVPLAPGGTVDRVARLLAKGLAQDLGQPVLVENRPGASGLVGTREVARARPDGYTLLAVANTFVSAPAFVPEAGYDPIADFAPVTQTCQIPMVLVAHPTLPERNVEQLIARARAHPNEISYGSSGIGSTGYIAAELLSRQAGINMLSVSYKGNAQALTDLVGGQLMIMFDQVSTSAPFINQGKLRALGVTTVTRSRMLPDVPTIAESGLPGYEDVTFNALFAPAGTPADVIARLHSAVVKVLQHPDLVKQLAAQGIEARPSASPEAFARSLQDFVRKYREIADGRSKPKAG